MPAGLWVARQPPTGSPGEVERIDTRTGEPEHAYQLNILPEGIAVGHGVIWVLGTKRNDSLATLLRIDPQSGRVQHRLQLAEQPSCATEKFASCYPVATTDGVWVPLLDRVVHVNKSGTMADQSVQVSGHVWDLTGNTGQLWALAETAIYRITERTASPSGSASRSTWAWGCSRTTSPPTATRCGSRASRTPPQRRPAA